MIQLHTLSLVALIGAGLSLLPGRLAAAAPDLTSAALWQQYVAAPDTHPTIPNNSFAGVFRGERPIPTPPVSVRVTDHGAKPDGSADATEAFKAAIAAVAAKGGGTVAIPAGTYRVDGMIHLHASGVVLRGEGPGRTILDFTRALDQVVGPFKTAGKSEWSWAGGLVWIGPDDTFGPDGKVAGTDAPEMQAWEMWHPGPPIARATAPAARGDWKIQVDSVAGLKPGATVLMAWENPADASLLKTIAGHPSMEPYNWPSATWILPPKYPVWQWPVEIAAVEGSAMRLAQPLRVPIVQSGNVVLRELGPAVRGSGIEAVKLKLRAPAGHRHLQCAGWNGVYFNRALHCWARNLEVENAENPIILAAAKNVSVDGLAITGPSQNHHSIACRVNSHDNLIQNFVVDGPGRVKHGINIEWLSSGNVYSKGRMMKGTFDSHRALSFDLVRTEISVTNDADGPGGANEAGPFLGARVVHWNIEILKSPRPDPAEFIYMPEAHPSGALVGIRGAAKSTAPAPGMPRGDKGAVVADDGKVPSPKNLYEAQVALRLRR